MTIFVSSQQLFRVSALGLFSDQFKKKSFNGFKYTEFGIIGIYRNIGMSSELKQVLWISAAKKDLEKLPRPVIREFGYALYQAQTGAFPDIAKVFKGFGSAEVIELRENDPGGTYRVVYTVRFEKAIVVLHVFQKKSPKGIETSKQDRDLIHERFKQAEWIYRDWIGEK
ncbi:MAG TPA: type II toxin-antitoxin system RelE/ParE family toxin [Chlamydiales bacterium]|nr:type II toxin-antitoxin system RelE/ParE family toxin [Chlamydiales bacterium]